MGTDTSVYVKRDTSERARERARESERAKERERERERAMIKMDKTN